MSMAKNPFAVPKKTTIKRERDEVYPQRKGLNKPDLLPTAPLDLTFHKLETVLANDLESTTLESLSPSLLDGAEASLKDEDSLRYAVVSKLLLFLVQIRDESLQVSEDFKVKELISISLHDMKTFGKLLNLIIILGIYPSLGAFGIGIPIEKRRMKSFGKLPPIKVQQMKKSTSNLTNSYHAHNKMLKLVYDQMKLVLLKRSDVRSLLLNGTGYSDFIVCAIALATVPNFDQSTRLDVLDQFLEIASFTSTYDLYSIYTLLLSTPSPDYYKRFVVHQLEMLPYNAVHKDGVLTLIEFALLLREEESVNIEKFDHVANVLLLKPKSVSTVEYFNSIGSQCFELLGLINRPTVTSCVCHFLELLWMKNKRVAQDFFFQPLWMSLDPEDSDLTLVLVLEKALNHSINVSVSVTNLSMDPELVVDLFIPILLPIWRYYMFLKENSLPDRVIHNVIVSVLTVISTMENIETIPASGKATSPAEEALNMISENLVSESDRNWNYRIGSNKLVEIYTKDKLVFQEDHLEEKILKQLKALDSACGAFCEILEQLDSKLTCEIFLRLLTRWIGSVSTLEKSDNPFMAVMNMKLLESIGSKFKDAIAANPLQSLQILLAILRGDSVTQSATIEVSDSADVDSDDEDDSDTELENDTALENETTENETSSSAIQVALQLLSAIVSETLPGMLTTQCRGVLKDIQTCLVQRFSDRASGIALSSRIGHILEGDIVPVDALDLDRIELSRAVASLNDPLVPIRAHGLYLLRGLVDRKSDVVSTDFAVNLHLVQLKDPEPYIYLNAIKGIESLLQADPDNILPVLLSIYLEVQPSNEDIDEKLKVGEVLLRFVQTEQQLFSGPVAMLVTTTMLDMVRVAIKDVRDDRLRMSAMSILGTAAKVNVLGMANNLPFALDCAVGILQMETAEDKAIMRRSALVLIHDVILGTSQTDKVPFPQEYRQKVWDLVKYALEKDTDCLVQDQAKSILSLIEELVEIAFNSESTQN